jgi:para-aminobenzoate synthetase component 1
MRTRRLALDLTPWRLFRALARKERPFFIDAARPWDSEWASSMGFGPRMQLRVDAGTAETPLAALDALLAALAPASGGGPRAVPFGGGAVVALAYEAKNTIERVPQTQALAPGAPYLVAQVYDAVLVYDHRRRTHLCATWHLDDAALARYAEEVSDAVADAARGERRAAERRDGIAPPPRIASNLDAAAYAARVERIREYIAAGDVYQVNLSLRLETALGAAPVDLYGNLRRAQPVPFGAYVDLGREQILSNSPELFLRRRGERIETCPIKGTRRRGATAAEDARLADELRRDAKERAEHVMIVDLERSDLGRVCVPGTIGVARFAEVVGFRTLQHLVSSVRGRLRPGVGTADLLRATFPGGSITGAPKIRAMEIIDEVERAPRGFYTGALGWIDASGDLDLNVAIRTAVIEGGALTYHAGSGIVADSEPGREHAESLLKARAFLRAVNAAGGGAAARPRWAPESAGPLA